LVVYTDGFQIWNSHDLDKMEEIALITAIRPKLGDFCCFSETESCAAAILYPISLN
jgi:hypothetical protein